MYVRARVHLSSSCHSSNSTVGPLKVSMCLWKWKPRMHSQQQVLGESWNIQQDHRCPVSVFTEIQCTSYFQKRLYIQTVQMTLLLEKVCAFSSNIVSAISVFLVIKRFSPIRPSESDLQMTMRNLRSRRANVCCSGSSPSDAFCTHCSSCRRNTCRMLSGNSVRTGGVSSSLLHTCTILRN